MYRVDNKNYKTKLDAALAIAKKSGYTLSFQGKMFSLLHKLMQTPILIEREELIFFFLGGRDKKIKRDWLSKL